MMESEYADTAVFFSLGGVGLSLINSMAEEVAFVTLSKSAALWEVEVRNKWKTLNMELASLLEQKWLHDENSVILEDYLEVMCHLLYNSMLLNIIHSLQLTVYKLTAGRQIMIKYLLILGKLKGLFN